MFSVPNARSSPLSLRKIMSANRAKRFPWRKTFCFGQSDQRIEYSSSDSSRPSALAWLGFWWELPNRLWNVNFTTITSFPATLNADFFMKQLLLKLCMWCRPLVSLWIKYGSTWHITKPGQNNRYSERKVTLLNDIALMIIENRQEPCYFLHSFSV